MEYRIGGVKPLFVTSLRVNIRAGNGIQSFYDSLDLYASRNRLNFAQSVFHAMGTDPALVEQNLVQILEHLERDRDAMLMFDSKQEKRELSAAEYETGMEFLKDPDLFSRIAEDLSALGYVGETINKLLVYICASSRKLDDPVSVLIVSQSASGKSRLVDTVRKLIPEEDVVYVTSLSDQALNYVDTLFHKFLVLGEAVHGDTVEYQIREMLSGKELSRLVTVRDTGTGKLSSRVIKTPIVVSSVMGTTRYGINQENASRCFMIHADESREQTALIHESQRKKYSFERFMTGNKTIERIIQRHHAAQRLLRNTNIVNDFAQYLDFPTSRMRMRRDHDRFLDLIACVCFMRQYQKKEEYCGDLPFIRCDLEDYRIAYSIMIQGVLSSTVGDLPNGTRILYDDIRVWARNRARQKGINAEKVCFTQRQIREATGLGHTWVKANIKKLVEYDYLEGKGGERRKTYYRLKADEDIPVANLSMIPAPEAIDMAIKNNG
jgi:energy-coupling factor transporter ATP-binding protein EcfA2